MADDEIGIFDLLTVMPDMFMIMPLLPYLMDMMSGFAPKEESGSKLEPRPPLTYPFNRNLYPRMEPPDEVNFFDEWW